MQRDTEPVARGQERLDRWQRATEWPMVMAALAFLGAYAWPIIDPGIHEPWRSLCPVASWLIWSLFAADYAVRLSLAPDRRAFVRAHVLDLLIVVLPVLRPLRLIRLLSVVSILHRRISVSLRGHVVLYTGAVTVLVLFVAALGVLRVERRAPDANITELGDALWWTAVTVSTVGYGDHYPVTTAGRWIAVGLFLAGIALLGVITGSLSSWFVQRIQDGGDNERQLRELTAEVRMLRDELRRSREGEPPP